MKDVDTFVDRFQNYCIGASVPDDKQISLLMNCLDDTVYRIMKAELTTQQKSDIKEILHHLLKRFLPVDSIGQRRLSFSQLRQGDKTLREFFTELLVQATFAFPTEGQSSLDKEVRDTFIMGISNSRTRLYLIERTLATVNDALESAMNFEAALQYNKGINKLRANNRQTKVVASIKDIHRDDDIQRAPRQRRRKRYKPCHLCQRWSHNKSVCWFRDNSFKTMKSPRQKPKQSNDGMSCDLTYRHDSENRTMHEKQLQKITMQVKFKQKKLKRQDKTISMNYSRVIAAQRHQMMERVTTQVQQRNMYSLIHKLFNNRT